MSAATILDEKSDFFPVIVDERAIPPDRPHDDTELSQELLALERAGLDQMNRGYDILFGFLREVRACARSLPIV